MRKNKCILILLLVLCISFVFVGCNNEVTTINEEKIVKKEVKEISLPMKRIKTLNPIISKDRDVFDIANLVYSSLFRVDEKFLPINNLASDYTVKKNKAVIELNQEATWTDGQKVSAKDVIFTYNAIKDYGEEGQYYHNVQNISQIREVNKYKIEVYFEDNTFDLNLLSFPIMPSHKYNSPEDLIKAKDGFKPMGSGEYKFKSYENTKGIKLIPNTKYYGDIPLSKIEFKVIEDNNNIIRLVESSNITLANIDKIDRKTDITKKEVKIKNFQTPNLEYLGFNFNKEIMQKKTLRKAISHLVDRNSIRNECYYNSINLVNSMYPKEYMGIKEKVDTFKYDADTAQELLKKAGYTDKNANDILEYDDKEVKLDLLVNSDNKSRKQAAEIIRKKLRNNKIEVNIVSVPTDIYYSYLRNGNFDMYLGGVQLDQSIDIRALLAKEAENNYTGYVNGHLEDMLNELKSGLSIKEQTEQIEKIDKVFNSDVPYYPIGYITSGLVKSPSYKGEMDPSYFDLYNGIETCESEFINVKEK